MNTEDQKVKCPDCNGQGVDRRGKKCYFCDGTGEIFLADYLSSHCSECGKELNFTSNERSKGFCDNEDCSKYEDPDEL